MKQKLFTLTNPGGQFFGDTIRAAVSATNICPPEVFNHDQDGRTINAVSPLRFLATHSWVGVLCDERKIDLMGPAVVALTQVVSNQIGAERMQCKSFETELFGRESENAITYVARNIAIKRFYGNDESRPWRSTRKNRLEMDDKELLEYSIMNMLRGAKKAAENSDLIFDLPPDEELELKIVDAKRSGVGNHYLISGKFQMRMNLKGIWQAGTLLNKGYGMIGKVNLGGYTSWIC